MSVAGDNERYFVQSFSEIYPNILMGKKVFSDGDSDVSISVDNSFEYNGYDILIEVDAGNMAKLLVGQYTLLNELYSGNKKMRSLL